MQSIFTDIVKSYRGDKSTRLYTCAIRPAAIYGPGEERHFPRILSLAKLGLAFFKIGGADVKTDWVYIDNLILALILASMGLLDDIPDRKGIPVAAGQAYFICDGNYC
jgi:nucleoside-diphosphate-sugar epimerase